MEKIQRKVLYFGHNKSCEYELWKLLGISKRSVVLGSEIVVEKKSPVRKQEKLKQIEGRSKEKPRHKETFLQNRGFREGLSFIHKVKDIRFRRNSQQSVGREKECQADMSLRFIKTANEGAWIGETDDLYSQRRNQSQQTIICDEYKSQINDMTFEVKVEPKQNNSMSTKTKSMVRKSGKVKRVVLWKNENKFIEI